MELSDISPSILRILANRGIKEPADIIEYMSPLPKETYDPFLMKGMEQASDMIISYAKEKRRICIYGDYDADGVTSVSLMLTILKELEADADYYIPSRFSEGYGLNRGAIDLIAERGTRLIVTVDNGCVAFDEIEYIKEKGMAVIVTDHHNLTDRVPDCIMLNPKQADDTYPYSFLCGCGVAFKLAQAICRKTGISKKVQNSLLDIVGIATVGDIVPLTGENRTLVKYGMDRIKRNERPGLAALLSRSQMDARGINSYNIAFGIVPRINSCGRMKTADMGVRLLTGSEAGEIDSLALEMNGLNEERKTIQDSIYQDVVSWIETECRGSIPDFIVYYAGHAHEGVTGIVASKVKEKYYRPVIILTDSNKGSLKGTGRSIPGVDLYAVLNKYRPYYSKFGGHAGACGLSMAREYMDIFRDNLNSDMKELEAKNPKLFDFELVPDAVIDAEEVTLGLARDVKLMEPFGEGNQRPVFRIKGVSVRSVRTMGREGQYRKFACMSSRGRSFDTVCFDADMEDMLRISQGSVIDIMGEVDENVWNGRSSVQVILRQVNSIKS